MPFPGPTALGRGIVVGTGTVPPEFEGAPVTTIADATFAEVGALARTVDRIHRLWVSRTPHVILLHTDNDGLRRPERSEAFPWDLGAGFTFLRQRLHFLVWANTWDGRDGEPVWWWAKKAETLGAGMSDEADVCVDGRHVWIDAGPRGVLPLDHIHAETIGLGSLQITRIGERPPTALSPIQMAAVNHDSGPARVIAPAGSGKTRTLTARMLELVDRRAVEPQLVAALAYNNRAANEMRDRLDRPELQIRTFHSLGWAILREARPGVSLIDDGEVRRRLDRLVPSQRRVNTDTIGPYVEALSEVRIGLRTPAEVESDRDDVPDLPTVFDRYLAELERTNTADHDEQIAGAIVALLRDPALRERWQTRCTHLLVDEFQDLTPSYLLLVRLLASPGFDVFGVGDDDQTIYGYAGADPEYLLGYDRLFPGASEYQLDTNYRCSAEVVEAASHLLTHNRRRIPKTIVADRAGDGSGLRLLTANDDALGVEAAAVVTALLEEGAEPGDIAVLARVNSALLPVHAALVEIGAPIRSPLGRSLLERTVLSAVFAWIRIAQDPERMNRRDVLEAVRRPHRRLNRVAYELIGRTRTISVDDVVAAGRGLDGRQGTAWDGFVADIRIAARAADRDDAGALIDVLVDRIGLSRAATALDSGRSRADRSAQSDDLVALRRSATVHPSLDDFHRWLVSVLNAPQTDAGVLLTSIHRVKGLEWPHVVVFGAERGLVPHSLADDVEEERRVLHVAITRSSESTTVLSPASRPSPFLAEMEGEPPTSPIEEPVARPTIGYTVAPGDVIRISGGFAGTITEVTDDGVLVDLEPGPGRLHVRWGDRVTTAGGTGPMVPTLETGPVDTDLLDRLKAWRTATAASRSVPAYVVFSDATLESIATARPRTEMELSLIKGVGPKKLDDYADDILDMVGVD